MLLYYNNLSNENRTFSFFSASELVISTYIDVILACKPKLSHVLNNQEDISQFMRKVLFSVGGSKSSCDWLRSWSAAGVDLQLSKCRLLLDLQEPVLCTEQMLCDMLSVYGMYEVHHEILSTQDVAGGCSQNKRSAVIGLYLNIVPAA